MALCDTYNRVGVERGRLRMQRGKVVEVTKVSNRIRSNNKRASSSMYFYCSEGLFLLRYTQLVMQSFTIRNAHMYLCILRRRLTDDTYKYTEKSRRSTHIHTQYTLVSAPDPHVTPARKRVWYLTSDLLLC